MWNAPLVDGRAMHSVLHRRTRKAKHEPARETTGPPGSLNMPRGLAGLSITELHKEIRRRQRAVGTLQRKRAKLMKKVAALDAQIAANGGVARGGRGGGGGGGGRRGDGSLAASLHKLLSGKTMSVTDAAEAVKKAGYMTSSPNFRTMVNAQLLNKKMFKRVERGQYTSV